MLQVNELWTKYSVRGEPVEPWTALTSSVRGEPVEPWTDSFQDPRILRAAKSKTYSGW